MRRLLAPGLALLATLISAPPALADGGGGNGGAVVGSGGITVTVGTPGSTGHPGGSGDTAGAPPSCGLVYISGTELPSLVDNSTQGYWVISTCKLGFVPGALTWVPTTPGSPRPVASVVAQTALSHATWPKISASFDPAPDRLLVNFPIWLHLASGWQQVTATATIAGVTATVTAKPESVTWEMGDGTSVTCHSQGTAYDPSLSWTTNIARRDCGYVYTSSSAAQADGRFGVKVTVRYGVTWTSNFGAGGSLGVYDRGASTSVAVGQVQSLEN